MMWLDPPQKRLANWRAFRRELDTTDVKAACEKVSQWWQFAPQSTLSIDPYDISTWPSVWEMLHQGDYCKFSTAIGMAYTIFYIDESVENRILRVYDHVNSDIYMTALINEHWLLNYNLCEMTEYNNVRNALEIQESWNTKDVVETTKFN